jgi:hypothetical protein
LPQQAASQMSRLLDYIDPAFQGHPKHATQNLDVRMQSRDHSWPKDGTAIMREWISGHPRE